MGFGAFLVTFCASKKLPGAWGRAAPEEGESALHKKSKRTINTGKKEDPLPGGNEKSQ